MSPRDEELLAAAESRLDDARWALGASRHDLAVGAAYYACLFAARAALSSRETAAKTHSGTWHLFRREFVRDGSFDPGLTAEAADAQHVREDVDYDARAVEPETAAALVDTAERFVGAVSRLFD